VRQWKHFDYEERDGVATLTFSSIVKNNGALRASNGKVTSKKMIVGKIQRRTRLREAQ